MMYRARMPDGSIVDAEWGYDPVSRGEIESLLGPVVVSIWAIDKKKDFAHRLGSGVKVANVVGHDQQRYAIIATCAHVVDFAVAKLNQKGYASQSNLFSPSLPRLLTPILENLGLHVAVHYGRPNLTLPVLMVSVSQRADLCVLLVRVPPAMENQAIVGVNSDRLAVGTRIVMAGYPNYGDQDSIPMLEKQFKMQGGLQVRTGKIIGIEERLRLKPVFGYETNIPMPAGFSGGPVFVLGDETNPPGPLAAIGICMSDASAACPANITAAGTSQIIAAENLYGVMDPHQALVDRWNTQPPDRVPDPPFGSYLTEVGKLRSQLKISYHQETAEFHVTRKSDGDATEPPGTASSHP
jgi:hypothetical protein